MSKDYIYRHTAVSRFQVTGHPGEKPFDFKNHLLRIDGSDAETRNERFLDIVGQMHPRDQGQIKVINQEAAANLERSLGPRVSRGAQDTGTIRASVKGPDGAQQMTQAQIDELAEQQRLNDENTASLEQAALDDATRLIAEGKANGNDAEAERLARVEAEEAKLAAAGKIDQSENLNPLPIPAPAPGTKAGLQAIKK